MNKMQCWWRGHTEVSYRGALLRSCGRCGAVFYDHEKIRRDPRPMYQAEDTKDWRHSRHVQKIFMPGTYRD